MMVDVVCAECCEILFINLKNALKPEKQQSAVVPEIYEQSAYAFGSKKSCSFTKNFFALHQKAVRTRVLAYLSEESVKSDSTDFEIPFDRQQMADYLNLDRSALSKELSKMKSDGIFRLQ